LYGCKNSSLTLRKEYGLRVFENSVLRRIFETKRDEVTEEWRKLHNGELHNLYLPPNIIRQFNYKCNEWVMWHAWQRRETYTRFWWKAGRKETTRKIKA
jgi:hypothetical protein